MNKPNCFCQSINIETGISDLHNLTGNSPELMPLSLKSVWLNIDLWRNLRLKNTWETWIFSPIMYVTFLMMWMILFGPMCSLWRLWLILMRLLNSGVFKTVKFLIWTRQFERPSTRGTCGAIGISGTSGILLPEKKCVLAKQSGEIIKSLCKWLFQ